MRTCIGGNGSLLKYADSFFSHWGQSFDCCSAYRGGRLFFYCSVGDDDYPPGSDEWHGTGNAADISAVSTDSGSNYLFRGRA